MRPVRAPGAEAELRRIVGEHWEKRAVRIAGRFTKTGKPIYVPLNSVTMAILKRRYEAVDRDGKSIRHPVYVFTWRGKKISQVVTKASSRRLVLLGKTHRDM
jgi:integrase